MPKPVSVMITRFPGGGFERADTTDWLVQTILSMKKDPRIDPEKISKWRIADTPITMGRNHAVKKAEEEGVDFLVMIDADMAPDAYHASNTSRLALDPHAKLFWDSSFDFAYDQRYKHDAPCMVATPYCGPSPHENIYIFHWENKESGHPIDQDMSLEQYSRRHASEMHGIVECGALPTGLILIDMLTVKGAPEPLFYYEWTDKSEIRKASTEDVTFTRDACLRGFPVFCNWDAWCGHWKWKCVGRPVPMTKEQVGGHLREAYWAERGADVNKGEEFVMVGQGDNGQSRVEVPYSGAVEEKPDLSGIKPRDFVSHNHPEYRQIGIVPKPVE